MLTFSKFKKWQLTLIVANPYQDGDKYSVYYGCCTRPLSPTPMLKEKSGLATPETSEQVKDIREVHKIVHIVYLLSDKGTFL